MISLPSLLKNECFFPFKIKIISSGGESLCSLPAPVYVILVPSLYPGLIGISKTFSSFLPLSLNVVILIFLLIPLYKSSKSIYISLITFFALLFVKFL